MATRNKNSIPEKRNGASGKDARPRPPSGKRSTHKPRKSQGRNEAPLRKAKPSTASVPSGALVEFIRAEAAFAEGLKQLKTAQKDFDVCARNKNLYSHALRALRHIALRPCEPGCKFHTTSQTFEQYQEIKLCWPCFARDALRRGGEPS